MAEPMAITNDMRNSREAKVNEYVERVNNAIQNAVKRGEHECYFPCDKDSYSSAPFYDEVRRRFESVGYEIVPTGYIGGVWQLTENIRW